MGPSVSCPHPVHRMLAPWVNFLGGREGESFLEKLHSYPSSPQKTGFPSSDNPEVSSQHNYIKKEPKSSAQVSETLLNALLWNMKGQLKHHQQLRKASDTEQNKQKKKKRNAENKWNQKEKRKKEKGKERKRERERKLRVDSLREVREDTLPLEWDAMRKE